MKSRWLCLLPIVFFTTGASPLYAESAVDDTIKRLRDRGEFDAVQKYLDRIERDPTVPAAIKKRIPYERAITLIRSIDSIKSAKQKHKRLDRASAYLGKFVKDNPKHALAGTAQSVLGKIFIGKAQVNIIEQQSPGSAEKKSMLRKKAIENVRKARAALTAALSVFKAHFQSFGVFIPANQVELRKKRQQAEYHFVMTRIDLAKCTYTEAHVYDRKNAQFRELMAKAYKQFEAIHAAYRSVGYGLYARMWQGKCFEEQGEIGRALGIYGELLSHNGKSALMQHIQRDALYFKLICENHESRGNHQLVEIGATEWWKRNAQYQTTPIGLGVKYELARARMILGSTSKDIPEKDKRKYLVLAKTDALFVAKYPGKHQLPAAMLLKQIKRLLGEKTDDSTSFNEAFIAAMVVYSNIKPKLTAYRRAIAAGKPPAEIDPLKAALKKEVDETARLHRLTRKLFNSGDDVNRLNRSRYYSAYLSYMLDQYFDMHDRVYDGAVLAEFASRHSRADNPDLATDAAYLAMVLYIKAYNQAKPGHRETEVRWIVKMGKYLVANWPTARQSAEASLNIGKLYDKREEPLAAARWFARVPSSAKSYFAQAQIRAGHAYWSQFVTTSALKQEQATILGVLRKKSDTDLVESLANLLNRAWRNRRSLERKRRDLLSTRKAATAPKKDAVKKKVAKLSRQILASKKQSTAELKSALSAMPSVKPGSFVSFPENKLRKTLLKHLSTLGDDALRRRHEAALLKLSPETLKAFFNSDLEEWKEASAKHLRTGIAKMTAEMPAINPSQYDLTDLITAKVSLAHYHNTRHEYAKVMTLLKGKPHSVVDAISVPDETKRPAEGIRGRPFAREVNELLQRASRKTR